MSDFGAVFGCDFGAAAGASAASRLFRADGRSGDTLAIALQIATISRPQGTSAYSAYTEALEAHVQAQDDLIAALREELAAKDELIDAKDEVIAAMRPIVDADRERREGTADATTEAMALIRQLGIHFREVADTARNIQAALRENDPRDAAAPACEALQAIIDTGDLFADSIAESAYTAIINQLTEGEETK